MATLKFLSYEKRIDNHCLSYDIIHEKYDIKKIGINQITDRLMARPRLVTVIEDWCGEHCAGRFYLDHETMNYYFDDEDDVALFRVRFG